MSSKCSQCRRSTPQGAVNGYGDCRVCADARRTESERWVAAQPPVEIAVGDTVAITTKGRRYVGTVRSAVHWGRAAGWYIEFTHVTGGAGRAGDPGYYKQGCDGGVIEVLQGSSEPLESETKQGCDGVVGIVSRVEVP